MNYRHIHEMAEASAIVYGEALAAYENAKQAITNEVRGNLASVNDRDRAIIAQRMEVEHSVLCRQLETASRHKHAADAELARVDNEEKNARRQMDSQTANQWRSIAQDLKAAAEMTLEAARVNASIAATVHDGDLPF